MSFVVYDLIFLAIFVLASALFLHSRRRKLKREGLMYLYRTKLGLKLIDWFGKKHARWLKPIQYVVLASGYILMITIIYGLLRLAYTYITSPYIAKALKVPVIFPLIPYLPEIFKIDFLPPFYFTYWIIIIALIAIPHEFAHGIFAKLNNIRIKSTGFGFLGPFLAAFVEQDDRQMQKASKFAQLSVLAAGTFANVLMTILFALIMWLFFIGTFVPAGINFNSYSMSVVNSSSIDKINGISLDNFSLDTIQENESFVPITTEDNSTYFTNPSAVGEILGKDSLPYFYAYDNSPAFNARLEGAITEFDGEKIRSYDELRTAILSHNPGDEVKIETMQKAGVKEYNIKLGERGGKAFLGIGASPVQSKGIMGWLYSIIAGIKDPFIYYESKLGDFGIFIYNLLWWIVIINISVALTNMLPLGPFDGGRFFMLTIWGITGSRKAGERAFKVATWIILAIVAALMVKWVLIYV